LLGRAGLEKDRSFLMPGVLRKNSDAEVNLKELENGMKIKK